MLELSPFLFVTLVSFISGAVGTGIGGAVGALFKSDSNKTVSLLLSFAGGIMTAMVCFELLAESIEAIQNTVNSGVFIVVLSVIAGVAVVYGLNYVIDKHTKNKVPHSAKEEHPLTHDDLDELVHADYLAVERDEHQSKASLVIAGIVMACAIALHNIPEGMTIGAGFSLSDDLLFGTGMVMAILIGFHNIPEGMAVAVPLISGGMSRIKAVLLTAFCGLPTLIGAWLGFWLGDIGPLGLACALGFASGAMLYVVFGEIFPEAYLIYRSKAPAFAIMAGMLVGLIIIFV